MIPILCKNDETKVGFLKDCIKAEVTEERNGTYELLLEYPVEGEFYSEIIEDRWIKAKPNMSSENQFFRIYRISKPINGIVTVNGEHISYGLSHYPVDEINLSNVTAQVAVNSVLSTSKKHLKQTHSFKVGTCNIDTTSDFKAKLCSARAALGGIEGSILDTYGGEYEFDNYTVNLHKNRGADRGVSITYGKNMTNLKLDVDLQNTYTGIYPYCTGNDDILITLSEGSVHVTNESGIAEKILIKDFTSMFEDGEEKNEDNLRKYVEAYLENTDINAITASMTVSMIDLSQTENYKNYAPLETVSLCDTVRVDHKKLAVTVKMKAIKITYDVLGEKNKSIELGSVRSNFADTIKQLTKTSNKAKEFAEKSKSQLVQEYKQAIEDATKAITGASGGYVVLNPPKNPSEILILEDSPDIATAKKLWRFNSAGLSYSSSGYEGPYGPALLAGGKLVINEITAQLISANLIRSGMIVSTDGKTYFNLDGSEIVTSSDTSETKITSGTIVKLYKTKLKETLSYSEGTEDGIKTYYSTTFTEWQDENNKSTGYERHVTDSDGTLMPISRENAHKHSFHSTIETAKDRLIDDSTAPASLRQQFAGFRHYRYINAVHYNVALGIGGYNSKGTAAIELQNSDGEIVARVDFFGTSAHGELCIKGFTNKSSKSYNTTIVTIGSDYIDLPSGSSYNLQGEAAVSRKSDGSIAMGNSNRVLHLYGAKIAAQGKLFCMNGLSQNSNDFESYSVVETEVIAEEPTDVSDYFLQSEIVIEPATLTTYSSGENIGSDEDGTVSEVESETITQESEATAYFDSTGIPKIIKNGDENTVDIFAMACLEWKAIKDIYEKLQSATNELTEIKNTIGGNT